jgi:ubiquinol-cytochrome c reductase cytochrome b subunit
MVQKLIDWFDLRLGVRDFYEKQFAFIIPIDSLSVWTLFSGLTIGCIMIQFLTGFYMIMFYVPVPELAHESIKTMCNTTTFGALFRNMHRYSSTMGMFFILIHAVHIMTRGAYKSPKELNWWVGMIMASIFVFLLISGIIVPWDWRSYWELIIWADWLGYIPIVGDWLKEFILSSFTIGRNYAFHIVLLPVLLIGFLTLHIVLVRRLGLSTRV